MMSAPRPHRFVAWAAALCLGLSGSSLTLAADQAGNELARLQGYVDQVSERLVTLQQLLIDAEQRNHEQSQLIDGLERELASYRAGARPGQEALRSRFFERLSAELAPSPVSLVRGESLVIAADPVFVFGTGEIGAEGQSRLLPTLAALSRAVGELPAGGNWYLAVQGHTDDRPIRNNARFPSNWELSAARSVAVLRYLIDRGVDARRVRAEGLAATRPLNPERSSAARRQNRRIEIRLQFVD